MAIHHRPRRRRDIATTVPDFDADIRARMRTLRNALKRLYKAVDADPGHPQDVSRKFRLNKNLTWKIARILEGTDAMEAALLMPGREGMGILFKALGRGRPPTPILNGAVRASAAFEQAIARHSGDRATLDLLLDSRTGTRDLELSRRLAFRGNSGVWGVQAKARVLVNILAPNARNPRRLDTIMMGGVIGLRRLRAIEPWPVFRLSRYEDDGPATALDRRAIPLDAGAARGSLLMPTWCSPTPSPLQIHRRPDCDIYALANGPVGRTAESTCFFGYLERAGVPRFAKSRGEHGEVSLIISLPTEALVVDFIVHRSLKEAHEPDALVLGRPLGGLSVDDDRGHQSPLPVELSIADIDSHPSKMTLSDHPQYGEMIAAAFARVGWDPSEFVARRLELSYPPMPATVVVRYALPVRT